MFGQIKDMIKMQQQAKDMQKKMQALTVNGKSKKGQVSVEMDGTQAIQDIMIDDQLCNVMMKDQLVLQIKEAMESAQQNLQKSMMQNMDLSTIKDMLGNMG